MLWQTLHSTCPAPAMHVSATLCCTCTLLVACGVLTFPNRFPHAAEDSLPELNYEGEPLKLSHFLQNGVRRPVLVRDSRQSTPSTPNPGFRFPGSSLGVHIATEHVSTLTVLAMRVPYMQTLHMV